MKATLEYLNKKTQKKEKTFDLIKRVAKFIGRANDRSQSIGNKNTNFLLVFLAEQINRSKDKIIFIDHDDISSVTRTRSDQNVKLMKQLADIFEFEYHRFIRFEGQKRCYGYIVKYTNDGIERINNPELFYPELFQKEFQIESRKNSATCQTKIAHIDDKNQLHSRQNSEIHAHVQYSDLRDNKNIKDDLRDLHAHTHAHTHTRTHEEPLQDQNQKDHFQNISSLQDQEECVSIEAQVENVPTVENGMVGKMNECVEQSADTSNSFIGELVRDPDLDFDYRSVTTSDGTQYMAPVKRVEEVKCYHLKDMAKEYLAKLNAQREQNNNQEPTQNETQNHEVIKQVEDETNPTDEATADKTSNEDIITTSPSVTSSTDNIENPRKEALWMTIEEMREAMARDKAIATAKQEVVVNNQSPKQPQSTTSTKPVTDTTSTQTSAVIVAHRPYKNRYLKDCVFTPEIYDAIRAKSKPHFSNDRIFAVARNIVANNPETKIWGGKNTLIDYMVKAINNQKEYTLEEIGESVAEAQRQRAEEERYQAENNIILWL